MDPTYLEHPEHGVHIVYDVNHLNTALAHGWKVREEPKAEVKPEPAPEAAPEPEKPRRGRPPKK